MLAASFTPPPVWGASPLVYALHSFVGFPVHQYVWGISVCDMGNIFLMLGVWGCSPYVGGLGGISTWGVHILYSCTFL